MLLVFDNINVLQLKVLELLREKGDFIKTRGLNTQEISPLYLQLENIHKRCTTLKIRHWSMPFALGELSWHLAGSMDVDFIGYYSKQWKLVSDDGQNISGSCYGHKIFGKINGQSQWDKLLRLMKTDIYTRRAVIDLYGSEHSLEYELKDVACSCSIQFLFRNNRLDAIVYMRSNDIIWGLPNDIFFFTMLQELLAKELGVIVGKYNHVVGSLHLYERHFEMADSIVKENIYVDFQMPEIDKANDMGAFLKYEWEIRNGVLTNFKDIDDINISKYWKYFLEILLLYKNISLSKIEFNRIDSLLDNPYLFLMKGNSQKFISTII